ncbi:MAG: hypothetical protein M3P39_05890, partial [Actinomycetota bacterium]|nr:hypothetical protein [Actinomycetota bacterium]
MRRVVGVDEAQADHLLAEQLVGAHDDRVEHLVELGALRDGALCATGARAAARAREQAGVLPLALERPAPEEAEGEHPGERAQDGALLVAERLVAQPAEHEHLVAEVGQGAAHDGGGGRAAQAQRRLPVPRRLQEP